MEPLYQKIEIEENRLFIVKSNVVRFFNPLFHFHPEYELTYVKTGSGQCLIGDRLIRFQEDDVFLLGPNLPHSWRSDVSLDRMLFCLKEITTQKFHFPGFKIF